MPHSQRGGLHGGCRGVWRDVESKNTKLPGEDCRSIHGPQHRRVGLSRKEAIWKSRRLSPTHTGHITPPPCWNISPFEICPSLCILYGAASHAPGIKNPLKWIHPTSRSARTHGCEIFVAVHISGICLSRSTTLADKAGYDDINVVADLDLHSLRLLCECWILSCVDNHFVVLRRFTLRVCASFILRSWGYQTASCKANPSFVPTTAGGDGDATQFFYVGFDPTLQTVIVAHQGTNPSEILPLITDSEIGILNLDQTLFPGISSSIRTHDGFATEHAKTATTILSAVEETMSKFGATSVTTVGHSLGCALALLDGVYLPLHLPAGTSVTTTGFGCPRVGNQAFADYVDQHLPFTHVNNREDFVPILPGELLGYIHPSGEVHIADSEEWNSCQGQDNPSQLCIVGDVPTIFNGHLSDHIGPYNGVVMGC